jgi:hypothetical protein
MDPDANISEQLECARMIVFLVDKGELTKAELDDVRGEADRLAELVQALDAWIVKGGALPKRWAR